MAVRILILQLLQAGTLLAWLPVGLLLLHSLAHILAHLLAQTGSVLDRIQALGGEVDGWQIVSGILLLSYPLWIVTGGVTAWVIYHKGYYKKALVASLLTFIPTLIGLLLLQHVGLGPMKQLRWYLTLLFSQ